MPQPPDHDALTLAGLAALYVTLQSGLLGLPRTQVGGGGSTATALVWTFDRVAGAVPVSWVMGMVMSSGTSSPRSM